MKKICFFNRWHNGDVFAGKAYMQDLIRQMPDFEFYHAQTNKLKSMADLPVHGHYGAESIPTALADSYKFGDVADMFWINTWVGAYGNEVIPIGENHVNWPSLYTMWMRIYEQIELHFDVKLERSADVGQYVPDTNWNFYELAPAMRFLGQVQRMVLVCNGLVRSTQTTVGLMEDVVHQLNHDYPDIKFVCTAKFDNSGMPNPGNVVFTDDIFKDVQEGDINEIAFLSTRAEVIIGKNSGPFMFCHVKENIFDPDKAFVSLSNSPSDSYAWNVNGLPSRYYHTSYEAGPSIIAVIRRAIDERGSRSTGNMIVIDA